MNTYVWKIAKLDVAKQEGSLNDVVKAVHYTVTAVAPDGLTAGAYGSSGMTAPGADFTAYEDLTEAQVIGWVQAALNAPLDDQEPTDKVAELYAALDRQIEYTRNPPVVQKDAPWA